jgi:hypothetical protein
MKIYLVGIFMRDTYIIIKIINTGKIIQIALFSLSNPINIKPNVKSQSFRLRMPFLFTHKNIKPNIGKEVAISPPCEAIEPTRLSLVPIIKNLIKDNNICAIKRSYKILPR